MGTLEYGQYGVVSIFLSFITDGFLIQRFRSMLLPVNWMGKFMFANPLRSGSPSKRVMLVPSFHNLSKITVLWYFSNVHPNASATFSSRHARPGLRGHLIFSVPSKPPPTWISWWIMLKGALYGMFWNQVPMTVGSSSLTFIGGLLRSSAQFIGVIHRDLFIGK